MVSKKVKKALLDVKLWQIGDKSSFYTQLVKLISMADEQNKSRLEFLYPDYVEAYNIWYYKKLDGKSFVSDKELFEYIGD